MDNSVQFSSHTDPSQKTQLGGKIKPSRACTFIFCSGHSWLKWHPHDEIRTQMSKYECRTAKKPWSGCMDTKLPQQELQRVQQALCRASGTVHSHGCVLGGLLWSSDPSLSTVSAITTDPAKPELSETAFATLKEHLGFSDTIYFSPVMSRSIHWLSLNFVINRIFQ